MSSATITVGKSGPEIEFYERASCALCGSPKRTVHRAFPDIPVVRCSTCGFLYSSRIMSAKTLEAYYRENFGSQRHLEGQIVNARTNAVALQRLLDLKTVKSWLDVGTGYGFLLKWLKERWGIRAEGVELSMQEANYAREELGLEVHSKLLSEAGLPQASFDVVSCFEVIEHISEPKAFLEELTRYLRPGGHLVVMTDNFESNAARTLKGSFPKWIPHTHVSHFGPESLRKCVQSVDGMKIEKEASYTPWDLIGRKYLSVLRPPVPDEKAYDVRAALATEMQRNYKLYKLRYVLNPLWTRIDLHRSLNGGALMYGIARKHG
jgi:2-polyprenyl-3-methyl-5-hydroxy-6-metoxy-1,4-benzoquinol methylase